MRRFRPGAALGLLALAFALPASADSYEEKRTHRLGEAWLKKAAWETDYDKARQAAKKSGALILAYFTVTYAESPSSKTLEQGLFSTPEFIAWSAELQLFCHFTTKVKGDKHQGLLAEKGGDKFPHLAMLDAEGSVLAVVASEPTLEALKKSASRAHAVATLRRKAAAGDKTSQFELLVADYEAGQLPGSVLDKRLEKIGKLSEEQRDRLRPLVPRVEVLAAIWKAEVPIWNAPNNRSAPFRPLMGNKFWVVRVRLAPGTVRVGAAPSPDSPPERFQYLIHTSDFSVLDANGNNIASAEGLKYLEHGAYSIDPMDVSATLPEEPLWVDQEALFMLRDGQIPDKVQFRGEAPAKAPAPRK